MGKDRRSSRGLTPEEERLWREVTKDVAPGKKVPPPAVQQAEGKTQTRPQKKPARQTQPAPPPSPTPKSPAQPPLHPPLHPHAAPAGLDRRNAERLRRGQMAIDARIDLHGMTQSQAHSTLNTFLARAQATGARCVIVITGKGTSKREREDQGFMPDRSRGVLKEMVPRWLNEPGNRARVLAVQQAQPKHGGGGALYVLLKKVRPAP